MAEIALAVIVIIGTEALFAAYCAARKSNRSRARGIVRIGMFGAFIALMLLSGMEWGFSRYGLALLLFVWALAGFRALLREGKTDQAMRSFQSYQFKELRRWPASPR